MTTADELVAHARGLVRTIKAPGCSLWASQVAPTIDRLATALERLDKDARRRADHLAKSEEALACRTQSPNPRSANGDGSLPLFTTESFGATTRSG